MYLLKVLGAVFVFLILFTPEYLPKDAFAACCMCGQCGPRCTCGCACGDKNGKTACITKIDKGKRLVTFKDESTGKKSVLPYDDDLFKNNKVGDCGMVKTKIEQIQMQTCTGFAMEPGPSQ